MADSIKMYDLAPSPNNMKVRIALNFKELAFERIPVTGGDRKEVVKISRQPLTPVLTHGDRVIFDSGAIMRYLEANFPDTRPLFSTDYAEMGEIEDWELLGRDSLLKPVGMTFGQFFAAETDPAIAAQATKMLNAATAAIEERLQDHDWLVGDRMTAADATNAPMVFYGMLPEKVASSNDIAGFFAKTLFLGDGRDKTRAWVLRVMAYDR